ncbi:MAG: pyruvate formate lyase family protein [Eubacteriales bacterium]|nr:pyruvate formate lyase family protein [Eubacteriales bacterium]
MDKRTHKLSELTLNGEMYVTPVKTEYDREDLFLPKSQMEVKRICEYILNQEPKITKYSCMTGFFNFDGSVAGDAFRRGGHKSTNEVMSQFYLKPVDNISTMEWQHATADYKKILDKGILGIVAEIDESMKVHTEPGEIEFLTGLKKVAYALIKWAEKCSDRALEFSKTVQNASYRNNLERLSKALLNVPKNKPSSFYEAILSIYVCFSADPDSVGTLDRYLTPFYREDIENKVLTREEAKLYLQELFLMLQAATPITSPYFTRGGESHFCVGGYLPNGEDGFNEVSQLIVESLMELPTYIPQVTLRWTEKTPHSVFRYMMDCERKDAHKRIAFTNDEKRIKCYTEICGFPYERAVSYTTVGCNEPAFLGAITGSNSKGNIVHCVETIFHKKADKIANASSFEEFYAVFENELFSDLEIIYDYDNKYNLERAKDVNYISSLFFNDCIENAKSLTQGGGNIVIASPMLLGIINVIDSLIAVKQFVFEEKFVSMKELISAVQSNWNGYEELRTVILKKGSFFGNDDKTSNYVAGRVYTSFYNHLKDKKNVFGYQWLIGDLLGYNEHHKWFGKKTKATPDGRYDGDLIKFGIGQSEGKDREGLTALLNSIAKLDPYGISCGSTVTNISLDDALIKNDDYFEKVVDMFEAYFKNGGVHFQLTYVSKDDLIAAQKDPEKYNSLRVRVTGFSDYFVNLQESIQDDIIERTTHNE